MNSFKKLAVYAAIVFLTTNLFFLRLYGGDSKSPQKIENRSVISIWPKGTNGVNPDIPEKVKPQGKRFFNIHNPTITVYVPEKSNGTAVVLCPGGAYQYVASGVEGGPVAEKLNKSGITVFVLKYRLPSTTNARFKHPVPLSDALRAIQWVRFHAQKFHIELNKIGIMGFSAGGHLASSAGTLFSKYHFGTDSISWVNARPDFMCLVYPVISVKPGFSRSIQSLVADKSDSTSLKELSNELNVTINTPPAFIAHAKDDSSVSIQNSKLMYEALKKYHVPCVLKLYSRGGHGFGLGREGTDSTKWTDDFVDWLRKMNFIPEVNSN